MSNGRPTTAVSVEGRTVITVPIDAQTKERMELSMSAAVAGQGMETYQVQVGEWPASGRWEMLSLMTLGTDTWATFVQVGA